MVPPSKGVAPTSARLGTSGGWGTRFSRDDQGASLPDCRCGSGSELVDIGVDLGRQHVVQADARAAIGHDVEGDLSFSCRRRMSVWLGVPLPAWPTLIVPGAAFAAAELGRAPEAALAGVDDDGHGAGGSPG